MSRQSLLLPETARVLTAATRLTREDNGTVFFLNSATEFDVVLPLAELGMEFTFVVKAAPASASYTVTAKTADTIIGHVICSADAAGDTETTAGGDVLTFADGQAVAGDRAHFLSDGTYWYVTATCAVAAGITITG
jgi:hypothetical protein